MGIISNIRARRAAKKNKDTTSSSSYQGPVRPGTSESVFRETGQSVKDNSIVQGPVRPGTDVVAFRTGGSSSSGGGGSSRGGGGGGASVGGASPTLTPPEVTSLEVVGGDTPASYSGGTISAYVPPTIKDIPSYVRTNIKDDFSGTVAGAAKIAYGSAKRGFQRLTAKEKRDFKTQQKFDTKVKELERGTLQVTAADKAAAFQGYQGTAITELSRVPDKTLIRDGSLGDLPSAQALQNRYQTEIENKKTNLELTQYAKDEKSITNYAKQLQTQINSNLISVGQANQELERYGGNLDTNRNKLVQNKLALDIKRKQNTLDSVSKRGRLTRLAVTTVVSVGAGFIAAPVIAAAPKIVQTTAAVVGGGALAYTGGKTLYGVGVGTTSVLSAAEVIVPAAAFILGAGISARTFRGKNVKVNSEIDAVLNSPELNLRTTKVKTLTSEAQIKSYKLSPGQEAEMIGKLKAGENVYVKEWELYSNNPKIQETINTKMPKVKINSMGNSVSVNQVSTGNSAVRVEVSKGKYKYVDITATKSAGRIDPSTGRTTTESVSIKAQIEPKPRTEEFFKTLEITEKPKTKLILKEGKIQRVTLADTYSFEGKKVKFDSKNLPTYDSLMDVVKSSKYKKYPSSRGRTIEYEDLTGVRIDTGSLVSKGKGVGVVSTELKLKSVGGKTIVEPLTKPIEFSLKKKSKPFNLAEDINKIIEPPKVKKARNGKQVSEMEKLKTNLESSGRVNFQESISEANIKKSIKSATEQFGRLKSKDLFKTGLGGSSLYGLSKNKFESLSKPIDANILGINLNVLSKQAQPLSFAQLSKQSSLTTQKIIPQQVTTSTYDFKPTKITPFIPPILPVFRLGGGKSTKGKKSKKKKIRSISQYTASLGAAEFQRKRTKVTQKQLDKLSRRTYTGFETRGLLEVVSEKEMAKQINKVKF